MFTQNTTTALLDDTRASHLREHADLLVKETADAVADAMVQERSNPGSADADMQATPIYRQTKPTYPAWPTSKAGPWVTLPPSGQQPLATRTDQMGYECYDQERGMPCDTLPKRVTRERGKRVKRANLPGHLERMRRAGTRQTLPPTQNEEALSTRLHLLSEKVRPGQLVYDAEGARLGRITVRFPRYALIERGVVFPRVYYVPLALIQQVERQRIELMVSEATLQEKGFASVPHDLNDDPQSSEGDGLIDISGASQLGKYPLTPAETGHYHYGPRGPGINTDASGSYAPSEIDPYGQVRNRPVKLYVTGKRVRPRILR